MNTTMRRSAEITIALPAEDAMQLFTPEGERVWAPGWAPAYPAPDRAPEPGVVFTTSHHHDQTVWIMVDRDSDRIRYAHVADGMTAGTVAVDLLASGPQSTRVQVTYDLTALTPQGCAWLDAFSDRFSGEIAGWSTHIADAVAGR